MPRLAKALVNMCPTWYCAWPGRVRSCRTDHTRRHTTTAVAPRARSVDGAEQAGRGGPTYGTG